MKAHASDTVADAVGERAKHYVDMGVDAYNTAADKSIAVTRKVDGYVRDNPWYIIAGAAGLGFLLGMLIRRR